MSYRVIVCSLLLLSFWVADASAVRFQYRWKKGDLHRYKYHNDTRIKHQMMGNSTLRIKTDIRFSQKVLKTLPGGRAYVRLSVQSLKIKVGRLRVATLRSFPPYARSLHAIVDKHGKTRLLGRLAMYIKKNQVYVAAQQVRSHKKGRSSLSAVAETPAGRVQVFVSVNHKTGRVESTLKSRPAQRRLARVVIKKDDPAVDLLPKDLFDMLVLPKGRMKAGSSVSITASMLKIRIGLKKLRRGVATLKFRIRPSGSKNPTGFKVKTKGMGGAGFKMPKMPKMPGMGGMGSMPKGFPGMPGSKGGMAGMNPMDMMPKIKADIQLKFHVRKGRVVSMRGRVSQTMKGIMSIRSKVYLKRR